MQRWNTVTMGKVLDYMRFPHAYALFPRKDSRANRPAKARASRREAYQNLYEESLTFEERPTFRLTKLQLRGLASVIDDPTFLEDGCKLEVATSRAPTLIVS